MLTIEDVDSLRNSLIEQMNKSFPDLLSAYPIERYIEYLGSCPLRMLFVLGGHKPLYEMHTDSRDSKAILRFTPDGWAEFYRRVSVLLEVNPSVRGVFGGSWFFDPKLEQVSPRLAYLRRLVIDNGGYSLRIGPCDSDGIEDATLLSQT